MCIQSHLVQPGLRNDANKIPINSNISSLNGKFTYSGTFPITLFRQKLEYVGMPGQCFYCKQKGHVLKDCPKKKKGFRPRTVQLMLIQMLTMLTWIRFNNHIQLRKLRKGKMFSPPKTISGKVFNYPRKRCGEQLKSDTQYPISA